MFGHNRILRRIYMYKQSFLQSSGIITFLCKYHTGISDTHRQALRCVFLVARCNIIRASWETKKEIFSCRKEYKEEFVWGTSLFWLDTLLSVSFFVTFFVHLPLTQVMHCLNDLLWRYLTILHNNFVNV